MKKFRFVNRKGYGLLEMMVTLSLFSLLTIAVAGVFDTSQESLNWNYHELELQKGLRNTLAVMSQEIKEASPSSPTPITISPNRIVFEIPSAVSGNTVTGWTQIRYDLNGNGQVLRTVGTQTTSLGNDVQALSFAYPLNAVSAPRTVQIRITGSRTTLKRNITVTVTGEVTLRNL